MKERNVGMPTDPVRLVEPFFEVRIQPVELTYDQWAGRIEARYAQIKPHLESITLRQLGDDLTWEHRRLRDDKPVVESESGELSLSTQGIFGFGKEDKASGIVYLWGLSRAGAWLLVRIFVRRNEGDFNATAKQVIIRACSLHDVLHKTGVEPWRIWFALGESIMQLAESRRKQYEKARELADQMYLEHKAARAASFEIGQEKGRAPQLSFPY